MFLPVNPLYVNDQGMPNVVKLISTFGTLFLLPLGHPALVFRFDVTTSAFVLLGALPSLLYASPAFCVSFFPLALLVALYHSCVPVVAR